MAQQHVVIIGGGFSGTALAIHLARQARHPLDITVVEPRTQLAQGVAYSTTDPAHRINVPAKKMQLSTAEHGDFDLWYRRQSALNQDRAAQWEDGNVYPQRAMFGRYIAEKFAEAACFSPATLRHLCDEAIQLEDNRVTTAGGITLHADAVVLAISHPPPALPAQVARALSGHPALIANPWQENALAAVGKQDRVAIIGSGLTMADNVASLQLRGHRGAIVAFSRHGLLPRPNATGDIPAWSLSEFINVTLSPRQWLRLVRQQVKLAAEQHIPWQAVLDEVRGRGQQIWQQFTLRGQQCFLRHLRAWWDVHRYRIAPQVSQLLAEKQQQGTLQILAARLRNLTPDGDQARLTLQQRNGTQWFGRVDKVIVTTGPSHAGLTESQPLLYALRQRGAIQADPLGLGFLVTPQSEVIDQQGNANPRLLVVGPAARGRFGELMGLPQVAEHAEAVAQHVLAALISRQGERCPVAF